MSASAENVRFYLGIDGGGTKTRAVVVDARGVEHGSAEVGSANAHGVGVERAVAAVMAAAQRAAQQAGARQPFTAALLGLAGLDDSSDYERLAPHLATLAGAVHLTNDAELLLSALPGQIGVALIAGTGSIAVGRDEAGRVARVGGWGHALGDEGSGYYIGRCALIAAVHYADGRGPRTSLLDRIMAAWDLSAASELMGRIYSGPQVSAVASVAQVAPVALQAARDGDRVAQRIIRRGAIELARAVVVAGDQLDFDDARLPVALGGSLLLHAADFRAAVLSGISRSRTLGAVAIVDQPALSAARAAIALPIASGEHPPIAPLEQE